MSVFARAAVLLGAILSFGAVALLSGQTAATEDAPATLRPGDIIKVTIWGLASTDSTAQEFMVHEDGTAVLPVLGPRKVTDLPLGELRRSLYEEYQTQLTNPAVDITPQRRVFVMGEVNRPGLYALDLTTPLAGAIALSGGPTNEADLDRIQVTRNGVILHRNVPAASILASMDIRSGDQIVIGQQNWLIRNSQFVAATGVNVALWLISFLMNR